MTGCSKRVLVTGGSGFIGTHLSRALLRASYFVRILDLKPPNDLGLEVEYLRGDVRDSDTVDRALNDIDFVFHFAAFVSVPLCHQQPLHSYETNLIGTCQILDGIRRQQATAGRLPRFVFSGSSAVYGNLGRLNTPLNESQELGIPLSFYASQKRTAEECISLYHKTFEIPCVVFRFFNVYGPGQEPSSPYSGVISIFADSVRGQRSILLHGGGDQTRDFVSVYDVVEACLISLQLKSEQCDASPINIASGQPISIKGLAKLLSEITGKHVEVLIGDRREGDVPHSLADISRAYRILGWKPKVCLEQGLGELLKI